MKRFLGQLRYDPTCYTEASTALQDFRSRPEYFHAVITDLALRGMSGLDLTAEILSLRPDIPVILASGHFSPVARERAARLGICRLIQKPNTMADLAQALTQVRSKER